MAKCKKRMRLIRRTVKRWNKVVVGWDVTPHEMVLVWQRISGSIRIVVREYRVRNDGYV